MFAKYINKLFFYKANYEIKKYLKKDYTLNKAIEASYKKHKIKIIFPKYKFNKKYTYVIYAEHKEIGDSNIIQLMIPKMIKVKKVVHFSTNIILGKQILKHTIAVNSKFKFSWFLNNCQDIKSKIMYFLSHSIIKFKNGTLNEILCNLKNGISIIIFPSGVIGNAKWKNGIGKILLNYIKYSNHYKNDLIFLKVDIKYDFTNKIISVKILDSSHAKKLYKNFNKDIDFNSITEKFEKLTKPSTE